MLLHLLRLAGPALLLVTLGQDGRIAVPAAVALYLGAFSLTHDVAHGALKLPRKLNEVLLSVAALTMLVSGHGMRLLHLRHHARPLAPDDVEGVGAATSFWNSLLMGPSNALTYQVEGWRAANRRERRFIVAESIASLMLAAPALFHPAGRVWVATCVLFKLTAATWASHLPHHPPRLLRQLALRLTWTRSATVLSFALHDEHHAHPKVPCAELAYGMPSEMTWRPFTNRLGP